MLFMKGTHEIAHLRTENPLHGALFRRHHMDLDLAGAQGGRDLQPDEACAQHDDLPGGRGKPDDGATVGKRAQNTHLRQLGARRSGVI